MRLVNPKASTGARRIRSGSAAMIFPQDIEEIREAPWLFNPSARSATACTSRRARVRAAEIAV